MMVALLLCKLGVSWAALRFWAKVVLEFFFFLEVSARIVGPPGKNPRDLTAPALMLVIESEFKQWPEYNVVTHLQQVEGKAHGNTAVLSHAARRQGRY